MSVRECPEQSVVSDYCLGRLDADSCNSFETHLDNCPGCQTALANAQPESDVLLDVFGKLKGHNDPVESESELQHGLNTALSVGDTESVQRDPSSQSSQLKRLRNYRLVRELGRGGMGTVYEAVHERLERTVAVKVLGAGLVADEQARGRFLREMKAVGQLDDPHIVRATDAGEENDVHYLVMEYIDGVDAGALLKHGPLSVAAACDIVRQAALGLATVHANGLVHRDIKPGNLIVTRDGQVKLLDLGLALLQRGMQDDGLTGTGQIMGTVDYMAPEQISNTHEVDSRADLYSLGCVFYHLLCGRAPYNDDTNPGTYEKLKRHLEQQPSRIDAVRNDVPMDVLNVVSRLMAKDPIQRTLSPQELAAELEPFCTDADLPSLAGSGSRDASPELQSSQRLTGADTVRMESAKASSGGSSSAGSRTRRLASAVIGTLAAILAGAIYINTGEGSVEVRVNEENVTVLIDGTPRDPSETEDDSEAIVIRIPVASGSHEITIRKSGFEDQTQTIRVLRHMSTPVDVTIERPPAFTGHTETITSVTLSPDGTRLLSASADDTVRLWDAKTGKLLETMRGHNKDVRSVSFLADGKRALSTSDDQTIRLWDVKTGRVLRQFTGHTDVVTAACATPDGQSFVSSGFDGVLSWTIERSTPEARLGYKPGETFEDPTEIGHLKTLNGHITWVRSVDVSADGTRAVTGGNEALVAVWDVEKRSIQQRLIGHHAPVSVVRFLDDGRVVSGGYDNRVLIFSVDDGSIEKELTDHIAPIQGLAVSSDGQLFATAASSQVIVWKSDDYAESSRIELDSDVTAIAFGPGNQTLIVGLTGGSIQRVDLK